MGKKEKGEKVLFRKQITIKDKEGNNKIVDEIRIEKGQYDYALYIRGDAPNYYENLETLLLSIFPIELRKKITGWEDVVLAIMETKEEIKQLISEVCKKGR